MELDAREAQELEEKTRFAKSLDKACARTVKSATITGWCKIVEELPSGESAVERTTKEDLQKRRRDIMEGREAVEQNTFLAEDETTHLFERADKQIQALDLQEAEHQTDNEKSKKLISERSSINHTVSHKEGVAKKLEELVDKESKALEETLDNVQNVQYKLDIPQKKQEDEKQMLEKLLEEQKEVNVRMCRTFSESDDTVDLCLIPTDETAASQVWTWAQGMFMSTPAAHQAFFLAEGVLRQERPCSPQNVQDMVQGMVQSHCVGQNVLLLSLSLAL